MHGEETLAGTIIDGRYHVLEDLGEERGASLFLARQAATKRMVWLRVLPRSMVGDSGSYERCQRNVRGASSLRHPNTLTTFAYGQTADGRFFVVTEAPTGPTLREILQREGTLPVGRAARIAAEVCSSLTEAHAIGVVHGSLAPASIIVEKGAPGHPDRVRVCDYGVGQLLFEETDENGYDCKDYQSAESSGGEVRLDARSDLYSLGVVLFEMLAGRRSSAGGGRVSSLWEVQADREVPVALDNLLASALARASEDRVPSAGVFRERLEDALSRIDRDRLRVRIRKLSEYRRISEASEVSRDAASPVALPRRLQTGPQSATARQGPVRLRRDVVRRAMAFAAVGLVALAIAVISVVLLSPWRHPSSDPGPSPTPLVGAPGPADAAGPVAAPGEPDVRGSSVAPALARETRGDAGAMSSSSPDLAKLAADEDASGITVSLDRDAGAAATGHQTAGTHATASSDDAISGADAEPVPGADLESETAETSEPPRGRVRGERRRGGARTDRTDRTDRTEKKPPASSGTRAETPRAPATPSKPEERSPTPRAPRRVDLEEPDF